MVMLETAARVLSKFMAEIIAVLPQCNTYNFMKPMVYEFGKFPALAIAPTPKARYNLRLYRIQ
jgi:hypothetical protein